MYKPQLDISNTVVPYVNDLNFTTQIYRLIMNVHRGLSALYTAKILQTLVHIPVISLKKSSVTYRRGSARSKCQLRPLQSDTDMSDPPWWGIGWPSALRPSMDCSSAVSRASGWLCSSLASGWPRRLWWCPLYIPIDKNSPVVLTAQGKQRTYKSLETLSYHTQNQRHSIIIKCFTNLILV